MRKNYVAAVFIMGALCAGFLVACMDISTGTGSNGGGGGGGGTAGTAGTSAITETGDAAVGVQGTGCAMNQELGIQLCTSTTSCPSVIVDDAQFPNCGWRILNGVADLQCDCNGLMCPIGTPTTCAQAASLLQNQTSLIVCQQLGEGRCVQPTAAPAAAPTSTGSGTCDQNCAADCSSNPNCLAMCGC